MPRQAIKPAPASAALPSGYKSTFETFALVFLRSPAPKIDFGDGPMRSIAAALMRDLTGSHHLILQVPVTNYETATASNHSKSRSAWNFPTASVGNVPDAILSLTMEEFKTSNCVKDHHIDDSDLHDLALSCFSSDRDIVAINQILMLVGLARIGKSKPKSVGNSALEGLYESLHRAKAFAKYRHLNMFRYGDATADSEDDEN